MIAETGLAALWLAAALPWWRIGAILGGIHLTLMSVTVMATGNHYSLDIVAGLVVVGVAYALARLLPKLWQQGKRVYGRSRPTRAPEGASHQWQEHTQRGMRQRTNHD